MTHISPGQRAVVRPTIFDRECTPCKQGYEHCCEKIGFIGLSGTYLSLQHMVYMQTYILISLVGYGGGLAKYIVAPAEHFYTIPDNVSLEAAALVEPLAVAWHAVNISPFKPNDNVLVLGGGPVGIGIIQVLKLQGAKNIMVAELTENRKRFASNYGATHILDPREVDVAAKVRELTDGVGADVVFDTAGVEVALNGAIAACRTHGTIVNIAVWEKRPAIRVNELMYSEVNYTGSALYDESAFREVIRALSYGEFRLLLVPVGFSNNVLGQLKPEKMVTSKIKLDEVVEKGFQALVNDRDSHCKILVDVQA